MSCRWRSTEKGCKSTCGVLELGIATAESAIPPHLPEPLLPHLVRAGGAGGDREAKSLAEGLNAEREFLAASLEMQTPDLWGRFGNSQEDVPALHSGLCRRRCGNQRHKGGQCVCPPHSEELGSLFRQLQHLRDVSGSFSVPDRQQGMAAGRI